MCFLGRPQNDEHEKHVSSFFVKRLLLEFPHTLYTGTKSFTTNSTRIYFALISLECVSPTVTHSLKCVKNQLLIIMFIFILQWS